MILVLYLKTLCDISYYMCYGSFMVGMLGTSSYLLCCTLLLSLCIPLSMVIDSKSPKTPLRFIPIAAASAVVILLQDVVTALILTPAVVYIFYISMKRLYHTSYGHTLDSFYTLIKPLALFTGIAVISPIRGELAAHSMPFILIYLIGTLLLIRMLRHTEDTLDQPGFLIMHAITIAIVCLISMVLFNSVLINTAKTIITIILTPIAYLAGHIAFVVFPFITWLINALIKLFFQKKGNHSVGSPESPLAGEPIAPLEAGPDNSINSIYYIIAFIFFIFAVVKIIRRLLNTFDQVDRRSQTTSYSRIALKMKAPSLSSLVPSSPAEWVRFYYRKLLILCIKKDWLNHTCYMDTSQIEKNFCHLRPDRAELFKKISSLYKRARYGQTADKQDASEVKAIYHAIKRASK